MKPTNLDHIRPIDQAVLDLLRQFPGMNIQDLTDRLEVTATAVRQRLDRLEEVELVERRKESVGRGRPQYRYFLTALGTRYSSVSYADLATALWTEVMDLPNPSLRNRILRRVARRMGEGLVHSAASDSLTDRMEAVAEELGRRKVPTSVISSNGSMPILQVLACPFPDLAGDGRNRQVCELEQEMLSEAIGQSVQLSCCRLDGHDHCQFRAVPVVEMPGVEMAGVEINDSVSGSIVTSDSKTV
jgi:predicted ArsR family transcriptional regulator